MHDQSSRQIEVFDDRICALGEGPLWSARRQGLFWVDILGKSVLFADVSGNRKQWALPWQVGVVVERADGNLAVAGEKGFAGLDFATGAVEMWCDPESHLSNNRFNDGKVDARGRFWAGTMSQAEREPIGALYRLDGKREAKKMFGGVFCSNGLAWSADDGTFYYIDTHTNRLVAFDVDATTGDLGKKRVVFIVDGKNGWMDGMCIDAEGMLWIGYWGGWRIDRLDPAAGKIIDTIPLPVAIGTSCAFGGEKFDQLYITTARRGLDEAALKAQPLAGATLRVRVGPVGLPSHDFKG